MTSINDNNIETVEMYQWGQEDDWTEFGEYDCPDLPRQHYKGPHRLDTLLAMPRGERMMLVCTHIARVALQDWEPSIWKNYYSPECQGWLYTLTFLCWDINVGSELTLMELSQEVQSLVKELGFEVISILDRDLFPPEEFETKKKYAREIRDFLLANFPELWKERDERRWKYFFSQENPPSYMKRN